MAKGIFTAKKKDGSIYYRSSINRRGKKISLGSFNTSQEAQRAYREAAMIFEEPVITIENHHTFIKSLPSDKVIAMINFRDNGIYMKTPIYLRGNHFSYYLEGYGELKFDNEDLFYYSSHTIMYRGGHLFVNDYGTQYTLGARYGIKSYSVEGRDFRFVNGDNLDYRYENLLIINKYQGVRRITRAGKTLYQAKIHINGEYTLGSFSSQEEAAVCYNKGADAALQAGLVKNFPKNYVTELTSSQYLKMYEEIELSPKYVAYLGI